MTSRTMIGGFLVIDCCGPIMGSVRENRGNCKRCSNRTNEIAEIDGLIHTDGQGFERCLDMSWFEAPSHHSPARSDPSIEVVVFTPFAVVSCNYSSAAVSLCVFYLLTDQSETNQKFNTCLMAISITSSSTLLHHHHITKAALFLLIWPFQYLLILCWFCKIRRPTSVSGWWWCFLW